MDIMNLDPQQLLISYLLSLYQYDIILAYYQALNYIYIRVYQLILLLKLSVDFIKSTSIVFDQIANF